MSTFRNVTFFRSDSGGIWAVRSHGKQDFNPDKHTDYIPVDQCSFNRNYINKTLTITDIRTGNKYISMQGHDMIHG